MPHHDPGYLLPSSAETGNLKVKHLKRYWSKSLAKRDGRLHHEALLEEWPADVAMLSTLGLGIEQTIKYLYQVSPGFSEFENWILEVNSGIVPQQKIDHFNAQVSGNITAGNESISNVLTEADRAFWDANGYIILRGAVAKKDCEATIELVCEHLGIKRHDPATWYNAHPDRQGIMVQLFQHPQLQKNRDTAIIRLAFEQLWGRKDILVNTDRVGFNPPETSSYKFPGPKLHWDVSIKQPIPFGTQGILYLADTLTNQGAFTLVPGFQNRIGEWMRSLPEGANPRTQDIYALGATPIAANAGDFIIWHQALPHGSSPNTAALPRFVQYINYQPIDPEINPDWI